MKLQENWSGGHIQCTLVKSAMLYVEVGIIIVLLSYLTAMMIIIIGSCQECCEHVHHPLQINMCLMDCH